MKKIIIRHIKEWKRLGYHISLFFFSLPSANAAIARVAERVKQGGHAIPEQVLRRRFFAGQRNFEQHYRALVDAWMLCDNTGNELTMIEWGEHS
jgi:predicted ABC-type ATPase